MSQEGGGGRGSRKEGGGVAYWPNSLVDCDGMSWRPGGGLQGGREEEGHISEYAPPPPSLPDPLPLPPPLRDE